MRTLGYHAKSTGKLRKVFPPSSPEAASRCHNEPRSENASVLPVMGQECTAHGSQNAIIGYQLYHNECVEEKTRRSSSICYWYTDADQMRVGSNVVHL